MKKFFSILENIIGYTLFFAFTAFVILYFLGVIDEETRMKVMGYIPYCYLGAAIVVLYKLVALVFTSFYQIKIEKRKEYLDEILAWQKIEEASTKQGDMLEQELTLFIENVKRMPEGNTDAVIKEIQDRLPEVVQKLVDQRVAEIKQNMTKENEERIQEINVLSANVSDVLERREHLLNFEAEIKRCQEDERKKRLAKTEEYTMLVFSLAGTSVEDVEKVCDIVKLFIETGQVSANKDLYIPLNKKLRNAELKQFVINIIRYNGKDYLDGDSFLLTAFCEWFSGKKENIAKNYSVLPKDSLVSKDGVEADFVKLRQIFDRKEKKGDNGCKDADFET